VQHGRSRRVAGCLCDQLGDGQLVTAR